jgi:hypothetical protein
MTNSFRYKVDSTELLKAAGQLDRIDNANIGRTVQKVVNDKIAAFAPRARAGMLREILLSQGYVSSKMDIEPSTNPNAIHAALVTQGSLVVLGHYSPKVASIPTKTGKGKGDPKRGVPPGRKASGVAVTIKRGQPRMLDHAFTMTLRQGNETGDKVGVFRRDNGILKHLYGIAPYSLFRFQLNQQGDEFADDLSSSVLDAIIDEFGQRI